MRMRVKRARDIPHAPAKGSYLVLYVVVIVKKEGMRSVRRLVQTRPGLDN